MTRCHNPENYNNKKIFNECNLLCYSIRCTIMGLLVALHVSAAEAIIRRFELRSVYGLI